MSVVGDSFGQAQGLYDADAANRRAAAADAYNQIMQQGNLIASRAMQQDQFQQQMQAEQNTRKQQADYQNRLLGVDAQRYGVESQWRNRQLDLQQRQLEDEEKQNADGGGLSPSQKATLHLSIAQQDAAAGFPNDPPQAQIDAEYIKKKHGITDDDLAQSIADNGNAVRDQMSQQFDQQSRLAGAGNTAQRWQPALSTTQAPVPKGSAWGYLNPATWLGVGAAARYLGTTQPDTSWQAPQADRVNAIRQAMAAVVKGGQVTQDPITGGYAPAMARPVWMATPAGNGLPPANRSMVGGFTQPGMTGANLPPAPNKPPMARSGVPAIAPARVYKDGSGARWQYIGQMADPTQDTNAANWQQLQ